MEELMQKVRRLQIRTRRQVSDNLSGAYLSVFKGSGVEFDEVRPYVPGDDVRSIDWNVTARMGAPYIKRFVEERELCIMLLVDISSSQELAFRGRSKRETASEIAALLAFSAIANNDKVGLILFHAETEQFIPPRKGQKHALRVVREILAHQGEDTKAADPWYRKWIRFLRKDRQQKGRETDISSALEFCYQTLSRKAVIFVVSDFLDVGYLTTLQRVHRKHDVVAVAISDRVEIRLPDLGLINLQDAETGQETMVDSSTLQKTYAQKQDERIARLETQLQNSGIDLISLDQDTDALSELMKFLRNREKRGGK